MSLKILDCGMDNVLAAKLGAIARRAGDPHLRGVGDSIDRGLILARILRDEGFGLVELSKEGKPNG